MSSGGPEPFSEAESAAIAPYFSNVDRPVFALINLPETVKGALFARYSRSAKSLRRLFLDEFAPEGGLSVSARGVPYSKKIPSVKPIMPKASAQRE